MVEYNKKYEATIGLEIHAELKTNSKMFCSCANAQTRMDTNKDTNGHEVKPAKPNWNICPVCLGMPGMLPVLNRQAIEWTIKTGLYLNSQIASMTKWDRKNYFYADLPKGYQISQYDLPICQGGWLEINFKLQTLNSKQIQNSKFQKIKWGITRIHLEEDTGTSKHPEGRVDVDYSLMDYNRAGVPLMELVTDAITLPIDQAGPVAKEFCQSYQLRLRRLDVADADMEKGQMRCEANISVKPIGQKEFGTKVEVKNLNSFKSVEKAINYEIERQIADIEENKKIIQETRGWDDTKGKTYTMRVKETSADYRYFPEPDLPPVILVTSDKVTSNLEDTINIEEIRQQLPETIEGTMERYIKLGISYDEAELIIYDLERSKLFDQAVNLDKNQAKELAVWIINDIKDFSIKPSYLVELIKLVKDDKISKSLAKEILPEIYQGKSPSAIIKDKGLQQVSDQSAIEEIIDQVLSQNSAIVAKIKSGKPEAMGFLVGQVMRESKGQANPKVVNEILRSKIR